MCSLRDAATDFDKQNVLAYGVSLDDVASIAAFAKDQHLSFPLLSDADGSVAKKFGVLTMMKSTLYAKRITFVIDDKGVVRLVDEKVDLANHGKDLLAAIQKLRAG
jgi:peroxiredoxin Q/BCP